MEILEKVTSKMEQKWTFAKNEFRKFQKLLTIDFKIGGYSIINLNVQTQGVLQS